MEKESEVKIKSIGLTLRSFAVGSLLLIFWCVYGTINAGFALEPNIATLYCDPWMGQTGILTTFLVSVISSIALGAMGFTKSEMIVIYVMLMSSIPLTGSGHGWVHVFGGPIYSVLTSVRASQAIPLAPLGLWYPKLETLRPMLSGGYSVPWGEWVGPLTIWFIYMMSFFLFTCSFNLILSHRIIKEEALPFPFAAAVTQAIGEPKRPLRERSGFKLMGISLVIGFLFELTYGTLTLISPTIRNPWPLGWQGWYYYDAGPMMGAFGMNMFPLFTVGHLLFSISLWFLAPTKVVFSAIVGFFIWTWIIPAVQTQMGLFTNYHAAGIYGWAPWALVAWNVGFKGIQIFQITTGSLVYGVTIACLALSSKAIGSSIKSAIKGEKIGEFSMRILWAICVLSLIVFISLMTFSETPIAAVLLYTVLGFLLIHWSIRTRGEAIGIGFNAWTLMATTPLLMYVMGPVGSVGAYRTMVFENNAVFGHPDNRQWFTLEGLRLAEMTNTRWKDIVIASIAGVIVSLIIMPMVYVWGAYTFGYLNNWPSNYVKSGLDVTGYALNPCLLGTYTNAPATFQWTTFSAGIAIGIALVILANMLPWWPINPLGFIFGAQAQWFFAHWTQSLIALVLKTIVLRFGGTEIYEKRGIPIATGLIIGAALSWLLGGLIVLFQVVF